MSLLEFNWWIYIGVVFIFFLSCLALNYVVKKVNEAKLEERFLRMLNKASATQSTQIQGPMIDKETNKPQNIPEKPQNAVTGISLVFNKEENRRRKDLEDTYDIIKNTVDWKKFESLSLNTNVSSQENIDTLSQKHSDTDFAAENINDYPKRNVIKESQPIKHIGSKKKDIAKSISKDNKTMDQCDCTDIGKVLPNENIGFNRKMSPPPYKFSESDISKVFPEKNNAAARTSQRNYEYATIPSRKSESAHMPARKPPSDRYSDSDMSKVYPAKNNELGRISKEDSKKEGNASVPIGKSDPERLPVKEASYVKQDDSNISKETLVPKNETERIPATGKPSVERYNSKMNKDFPKKESEHISSKENSSKKKRDDNVKPLEPYSKQHNSINEGKQQKTSSSKQSDFNKSDGLPVKNKSSKETVSLKTSDGDMNIAVPTDKSASASFPSVSENNPVKSKSSKETVSLKTSDGNMNIAVPTKEISITASFPSVSENVTLNSKSSKEMVSDGNMDIAVPNENEFRRIPTKVISITVSFPSMSEEYLVKSVPSKECLSLKESDGNMNISVPIENIIEPGRISTTEISITASIPSVRKDCHVKNISSKESERNKNTTVPINKDTEPRRICCTKETAAAANNNEDFPEKRIESFSFVSEASVLDISLTKVDANTKTTNASTPKRDASSDSIALLEKKDESGHIVSEASILDISLNESANVGSKSFLMKTVDSIVSKITSTKEYIITAGTSKSTNVNPQSETAMSEWVKDLLFSPVSNEDEMILKPVPSTKKK